MRYAPSLFVLCAGVVLLGQPATAQREAADSLPAGSLREMQARFRQARRPTPRQLVGRWVAVNGISSDELENRKQIEHHYGARRLKIAGHPLEWVLHIHAAPIGGLEVRHQNPWTPTGDVSAIAFRATDVMFEKEDGSDVAMRYRCRLSRPGHLVCLNADGRLWFAWEFTKEMRPPAAAPPIPRPIPNV